MGKKRIAIFGEQPKKPKTGLPRRPPRIDRVETGVKAGRREGKFKERDNITIKKISVLDRDSKKILRVFRRINQDYIRRKGFCQAPRGKN